MNMAQAWDKKKLSPLQESNSWSTEHRTGALSTEHREFMESKDISLNSYVTGTLSTVEVIVSSDK